MEIKKDKFGPKYVLTVYDPAIGMTGFLVIGNTALGLGKGGIRMTPGVTLREVARLARTMTWKNALAGIPFGGAKAGIQWNGGDKKLKNKFIQSFARLVKPFVPERYIAGPDVATGAQEMQWFAEAIGNWRAATGKPSTFCRIVNGKKRCGLPHELGSTGFGVAQAAQVAARLKGINIQNATVAIEGFGNVGSFTMKHLEGVGARIVAVADSRGTAYREAGLSFKEISRVKADGGSVSGYPSARKLPHDAIFGLPVDILIPASVTDVIHERNKTSIKAKIIVEGANIPMTEKIEKELSRRGILIVPDFVANMGGVVSSYAEYMGYSKEKMFRLVTQKVRKATEAVLSESIRKMKFPRQVALEIAQKLIEHAMQKG
jgi:glutamate dehydrogenase/leucine dehydrogenase